jgi:hypothetical protein
MKIKVITETNRANMSLMSFTKEVYAAVGSPKEIVFFRNHIGDYFREANIDDTKRRKITVHHDVFRVSIPFVEPGTYILVKVDGEEKYYLHKSDE